jgi:hypothetical protein
LLSAAIAAKDLPMKPLYAPFLAMALAACATTGERAEQPPAPPAGTPIHSAHSNDPLWHVVIWPDRISLLLDTGGRGREADFLRTRYEGVRETRSGGVRRWQAGRGTEVISVEIWDGPCVQAGATYREVARVRLSGRELNGCGGNPPMMRPL